MPFFNTGSFFDNLFNPINQAQSFGGGSSITEQDRIAAERLANERRSGVSNLSPTEALTYAYSPNGTVTPDVNTTTNTGDGSGGGGGSILGANTSGSGNDGGLSASIALAQAAADESRRRAGAAYGQARGIYDEGIGLLGERRNQFQDIFDTGSNQILGAYEGERGNLQATAQNQDTSLRNSLRALGLGGSAFLKGQGRNRQQQAKAAGNLSTQRSANDRTNLQGFNTNQEFANTQESALNRFLQSAQESKTATENQAGLVQQGDVNQINTNANSLLSNIYNQQAALQAAGGDISGYAANPFAPTIAGVTGALGSGAATLGGGQTGGNQASNVTQDQLSFLDKLKQRSGGNIYT